MAVIIEGYESPMRYADVPNWVVAHGAVVAVFLDACSDQNRNAVSAWGQILRDGRMIFLCQPREKNLVEEVVADEGLKRCRVIVLPGWSGGRLGREAQGALDRLETEPNAVVTAVSNDPRGFSAGERRPSRGRLRKFALEFGLRRYLQRWNAVLPIQDDKHEIVRLADASLLRDRLIPRFFRIGLYATATVIMLALVHVAAFVTPIPRWRTLMIRRKGGRDAH